MNWEKELIMESISRLTSIKDADTFFSEIEANFKNSDLDLDEVLKKIFEKIPSSKLDDNLIYFLKKLIHCAVKCEKEKKAEQISKKNDWEIVIELLKKTDAGLFIRISRKMIFYLCRVGIEEAHNLLDSFGATKNIDNIESIYESNKPSQKKDLNAVLSICDHTFALASRSISDDEIFKNVQKWVKEDKLNFLVKAVKNLDSTLNDIFEAITRYHLFVPEEIEFTPYLKENINVLLLNRFLTDQLNFIGIGKNYVEIDDFYELLSHTISPNNSHGRIGGKSAGIFLAEKILKRSTEFEEFKNNLKFPKTWFITSDTFQYFLYYNDLEELVEQKYKDNEQQREEYPNIIQLVKNAFFPPEIIRGLLLVLEDFGDKPIVVRSSSLLEDSFGAAFSGKYKSLFLGNQGSKGERLTALMDAIAEVYASTYGPDPLGYRKERGLLDFNEEMAILLQEVVGTKIGKYYLPAFAGVAFNRNEFRWSPRVKREDGLIRIVMGLGTRAVDRVGDDYPVLISPGQPKIRVNVTPEDIARYSPKKVDVINLQTNSFETIEIDGLLKEYGEEFPEIDEIVSVYKDHHLSSKSKFNIDFDSDDLVVTFDRLFSGTKYIKQIKLILELLKEKMGTPIDIEFASDGKYFYLLQCRPQSFSGINMPASIPNDIPEQDIIFTARQHISNGKIPDITHIVYIDPDKYDSIASLSDLKTVGKVVGKLNRIIPKKSFILMGPGRWGSRGDIKLGVNVTYSDINNTAMLIEIARKKGNYTPDLSFGTHFFQDLVESSIRYLPLYPDDTQIIFNEGFFIKSENILRNLLPEYTHLEDVINVIDVYKETGGKILKVLMNADIEKAVAFLEVPSEKSVAEEVVNLSTDFKSDNHWRWRSKMAEIIASNISPGRFGVSGVYLAGSTYNASAGPDSDIDLIINFVGNEEQKETLLTWFEGWNLSLSEINYFRTGIKVDRFLDVKLITNKNLKDNTDAIDKISMITGSGRWLNLKN